MAPTTRHADTTREPTGPVINLDTVPLTDAIERVRVRVKARIAELTAAIATLTGERTTLEEMFGPNATEDTGGTQHPTTMTPVTNTQHVGTPKPPGVKVTEAFSIAAIRKAIPRFLATTANAHHHAIYNHLATLYPEVPPSTVVPALYNALNHLRTTGQVVRVSPMVYRMAPNNRGTTTTPTKPVSHGQKHYKKISGKTPNPSSPFSPQIQPKSSPSQTSTNTSTKTPNTKNHNTTSITSSQPSTNGTSS